MYLCKIIKGFFYLGVNYSAGETPILSGDDLEVVKRRFPDCVEVIKRIEEQPKIMTKGNVFD